MAYPTNQFDQFKDKHSLRGLPQKELVCLAPLVATTTLLEAMAVLPMRVLTKSNRFGIASRPWYLKPCPEPIFFNPCA